MISFRKYETTNCVLILILIVAIAGSLRGWNIQGAIWKYQ
jgi:hypothetical protein